MNRLTASPLMMKRVLWLLLGWAVCPAPAFGHNVAIECKLACNEVRIYVFYDDDSDAAGAKVEVLDGAAKVIASGKTDGKGLWKFTAPPPGKYQVHADAGAGHKAKQSFTIPEPTKGAGRLRPGPEGPGDSSSREPTEKTISDGPSRQEVTAYPWLKIALGIGIIGLVAVAFVLTRLAKGSR